MATSVPVLPSKTAAEQVNKEGQIETPTMSPDMARVLNASLSGFPNREMIDASVRIVSRKNLRAYAAKHPNARPALVYFEQVAKASAWTKPEDVKKAFPKASVISGERVRFEIEWNVHRMICSFNFRRGIVFVKFLGTHADYDAIDAKRVAMF